MRKTWKKLIACISAGAMIVTSLSAGVANAADDPNAITVGTQIVGDSTAYVETPDNPAPFRTLNAMEITEEMGQGWNLGNTLDGHSYYAPGETLWQNVVTTKTMIKAVHDMGFNTIRIPVTWGNMINEDYSVDELWMSRVQDVVDYAVSQNMYVTINVHHDGAWNGDTDPHGWLDIAGTEEEFTVVRNKFNGLWKTIAERFKNYDEHLTFASMNEVYDSVQNLGWSDDETKVNVELERINALNQDFVNVVRATGSNNAKRWLICPTKNTQIKTAIEDRFNYVVPTDTANSVMLEVHDYDAWGLTSTREGTKDTYAYQFKALKEQYVDQGVPVVIGEWGFHGAGKVVKSYEGVSFLLKKYNLIGCVWDNNGFEGNSDDYGLVDRTNEVPMDKTLTDAMMRGYFAVADLDSLNQEVVGLTGFEVSQTEVSMKAGENLAIEVSGKAPEANNDVILWKSDDAEIASVYNGKITARAVGTTTITAFSQNDAAVAQTITVTVEPQALETASTAIATEYTSFELENGGHAYINASTEPAGNGAWVTYKSSDESVVTVSTMGKLVALKLGEATITATSSDGVTKEIPVSVVEPKAPENFNLKLALHAYYNDKTNGYYGTEVGTNVITVSEDGTYTLKFDCATDLSEAAKSAGVTNLNNIGSLYIRDWSVTNGDEKRSPNVQGKVRFDSIKVNGAELLPGDTQNQNALKGGIFDTGNPINVWDGSVVTTGITEDKENYCVTFTDPNPAVIEVTFTLCGFTGPITEPDPIVPTEAPTEVPPTVAPNTNMPTSAPAITPGVEKGDEVSVSGGKYTVTDTESKTVEYKATGKKNAKSVTVPATVKITENGEEVEYKVTSIAANAYKGNKKLKSVVIGKNVKTIGANAFNGCSSLKKITVKSTVLKKVGKNALKGVHKKCKIKVPKKKLASYKKLFKGKGQKKSVKVVK